MHRLFEELLSRFMVREEYMSAVQFSLEYSYTQSAKGQEDNILRELRKF